MSTEELVGCGSNDAAVRARRRRRGRGGEFKRRELPVHPRGRVSDAFARVRVRVSRDVAPRELYHLRVLEQSDGREARGGFELHPRHALGLALPPALGHLPHADEDLPRQPDAVEERDRLVARQRRLHRVPNRLEPPALEEARAQAASARVALAPGAPLGVSIPFASLVRAEPRRARVRRAIHRVHTPRTTPASHRRVVTTRVGRVSGRWESTNLLALGHCKNYFHSTTVTAAPSPGPR